MAHKSDIIVVGGGLVGASLACALEPLGYRITLMEAVQPRTGTPPSYDDRTLALGQASCKILESIGLWDDLEANATPIRQVSVSELGRPGRVVMDAREMNLDRFGNVIEARVFGQAVMQRVEAMEGVQLECPLRATAMDRSTEGLVRITATAGDSEQVHEARLVIGADGADSPLREMAGISAHSHDYGQVAIIANVMPEHDHEGRAFERMTSSGPFALLPHVGGRCGLVWCVPEEDADALMALSEDEFLGRATERSGRVLGKLSRLGQRSRYPLRRVVPERDWSERLVLMGNAAHAIHPVGAQGFNLGLRDAAVLAEVLADAAMESGVTADPGEAGLLEQYSRWRAPDHRATLGWSHDMVQIFSSEAPLTRHARSLGLALVGMAPPLRRRMASRAMGYRGRTPRLAHGEPLLTGWTNFDSEAG